jgi:ferredoxin-NADP reductase
LDEDSKINLKEWNICEFVEKEYVSGPYTKYRFNLPYNDASLPLAVGQELVMCSVDSASENKVVKESFFPVSPQTARGYFEILVSSDELASSSRFAKALKGLEEGDELAFKGGSYRLRYDGRDDPITFISFLASGLGITTTLQALRGVLSEGDSTVVDTEVLWINEDLDDYVCDKEIEGLEYKFIEKCAVTRVVQRDLYHNDISRNKQVLEAVAPYESGRIAVVCAPSYLISKARQLYVEKGYPNENIISIGL